MSESVVSPTPVFMGEIGPRNGVAGPSVIGGTSAVSLHTDVPGLVFAGLAELRAHASAAAASNAATQLQLSSLRTEIADRFSAQTVSGLQAKIADMTAASQTALLNTIAAKVGATIAGA